MNPAAESSSNLPPPSPATNDLAAASKQRDELAAFPLIELYSISPARAGLQDVELVRSSQQVSERPCNPSVVGFTQQADMVQLRPRAQQGLPRSRGGARISRSAALNHVCLLG